jgi:hypothetical protein
LLAQPKLNIGVPAVAGLACSWIVTLGTLPPTVQAPTAHCAGCPGALLGCSGATPTHKVTVAAGVVGAVVVGAGVVGGGVDGGGVEGGGVDGGVVEGEADGDVEGESDGDVEGEADGEVDGEADGEVDGESDGEVDGESDGDVVAWGCAPSCAAPTASVRALTTSAVSTMPCAAPASPRALVVLACSGSHDSLAPGVVAPVAAPANMPHEPAVSRTPATAKATAARPVPANRIERPLTNQDRLTNEHAHARSRD